MDARLRPKVILAYKSLVTELTALFYLAAWLAVLGLAFTYGMNLAITADMTVVRSSSQTCCQLLICSFAIVCQRLDSRKLWAGCCCASQLDIVCLDSPLCCQCISL